MYKYSFSRRYLWEYPVYYLGLAIEYVLFHLGMKRTSFKVLEIKNRVLGVR